MLETPMETLARRISDGDLHRRQDGLVRSREVIYITADGALVNAAGEPAR